MIVSPGLNTPNSTSVWQADNSIKLRAPFRTIVGGTDQFNAKINSTGLCLSGTNGLQVNTHNANCDSDPENHRMMHDDQEIIEKDDLRQAQDINNEKLKMSVVPNPCEGSFKLVFNRDHLQGSITIIDNLNRHVWSSPIDEIESFDISLMSVKPGIYFIRFSDKNGANLSQKFIIQ